MSRPCFLSRSRRWIAVLALVVIVSLAGPAVLAQEAGAGAVAHSVYGQGSITEVTDGGDLPSHNSVAVSRDASGSVTGSLIAHIDLAPFDLGLLHLAATLDCLRVHGNRAWFSGTVSFSSNPDVAPVGSPVTGFLKDRDGRADLIGIEPFGVSCKDRPRLTLWPVESGDYEVDR